LECHHPKELWIIKEIKKDPDMKPNKITSIGPACIQSGLRNLQAIHDVNELLQPDLALG
jgi:hypothetical protein